MFFGIMVSPSGLVVAFVAALLLMLAPLIAIGSLAEIFPVPMNIIVTVIGSYLVWPAVVAWLYKSKLRNSGRGSIIFYFYTVLYFLFFLLMLSKVFAGETVWHDYVGVLVSGAVSFGLLYFAYKTKSQFNKDTEAYQNASYEAQRAEDISRQAEAILLAEKLKEERNM